MFLLLDVFYFVQGGDAQGVYAHEVEHVLDVLALVTLMIIAASGAENMRRESRSWQQCWQSQVFCC